MPAMHDSTTTTPTTGEDVGTEPRTTHVIASRLRLTSVRHLPAFLRAARRIDAQARTAPGHIDSRLRARFGSLTFWTLSSWEDERSMRTFVASPPHVDAMRALRERGAMRSGDFRFWTGTDGEELPAWDDVEARFEASGPPRVGER
jgi:heme-degrading monooxygenase HmoA